MKYSCCIEMLYTEHPLVDRIAAASRDGFAYVEFWTWEDKDLDGIEAALKKTGMKVSIFQGNTAGRMTNPEDYETYIAGVRRSIPVAKRLGCERLFLMSDLLGEDRSVIPPASPVPPEAMRRAAIRALKALGEIGERENMNFVIEPLNTLVDHKGYSLCSTRAAVDLVQAVSNPRIKILYDAYHMQIMEGNIIQTIRQYHELFGHFHIADVPGRHQPGTGEMNYGNILKALAETGYDGPVGFEFDVVNKETSAAVREVIKAVEGRDRHA